MADDWISGVDEKAGTQGKYRALLLAAFIFLGNALGWALVAGIRAAAREPGYVPAVESGVAALSSGIAAGVGLYAVARKRGWGQPVLAAVVGGILVGLAVGGALAGVALLL